MCKKTAVSALKCGEEWERKGKLWVLLWKEKNFG